MPGLIPGRCRDGIAAARGLGLTCHDGAERVITGGSKRAAATSPVVVIDVSVLATGPMDGIRRYTTELLRSLLPLSRDYRRQFEIEVTADGTDAWPLGRFVDLLERSSLNEFFPWAPRAEPTVPSELGRFVARMQRSIRKRLPQRHREWALLHLPLPNTLSIYRRLDVARLVTVHDLCHIVCPDLQDERNCRSLDEGLQCAKSDDSHLIAVSRSTGEELQQLLDFPPDRITVIPEACDRERFCPVTDPRRFADVRARYGIPEGPILFSLCTLEPRKNLSAVVEAFQGLPEQRGMPAPHLVLAGHSGWGAQQESLMRAAGSRVHLIGHVADEDIPVLFSHAAAFVCMSFYEGFCLPLLEAMSCGCPVIHADRSAMPEVAGGAGLEADPYDRNAITSCMQRVICDRELRELMRERGLRRAAEFSWNQTAEQVLNLYHDLLQQSRGDHTRNGVGAAAA